MTRVDGLAGKQLEFGLQAIPDAARVGMLVNVASGVIIDREETKWSTLIHSVGFKAE